MLYPGENAVNVKELNPNKGPYTFIVLDGSWDEAKKIFTRNPALKSLKQAKLNTKSKSAYIVRTQPADFCLSTVETIAETLAEMESRPDIREQLVKPLHAMCNFQINHGAVNHDSKEFKEQNSQFVKANDFKKKKHMKN